MPLHLYEVNGGIALSLRRESGQMCSGVGTSVLHAQSLTQYVIVFRHGFYVEGQHLLALFFTALPVVGKGGARRGQVLRTAPGPEEVISK